MFELVQAVEYRGKLGAVRCVDHVRFSVVYISTDYYRGNVVLCRPFFLRACDVQTASYGSGSSTLVTIERDTIVSNSNRLSYGCDLSKISTIVFFKILFTIL
jgi:hypothetical protein